jgi:formate hydrogenlyase transcriptional activator
MRSGHSRAPCSVESGSSNWPKGETETFTVDESWLSQRPLDTRSGNKPFLSEKVAATERETIEEALRESQGRIFGPSGAAAKLGIARSTLESKIQSLNINKKRFKAKPRS